MPIAVRVFGWLLVVLTLTGAIRTLALIAPDRSAEDVVGPAAAVLVIGALGSLILFRKSRELRTNGTLPAAITSLSEPEVAGAIPPQVATPLPPEVAVPLPPQVDDELGQLWHQWKGSESPVARERLILHYAPLVKYVASRVATGLPASVEQADLVSYGMFGLIDALGKFEPGRGNKFETYAIPRIKGAIIDELRAMDWVPRSVRFKARELEKAHTDLESMLNRLADKNLDPTSGMEGQETRGMLAAAINSLSEREKIVVTLYYFEGLTLAEIGEILGVTESRVCQIHTKAVGGLRGQLSEFEWPVPCRERRRPWSRERSREWRRERRRQSRREWRRDWRRERRREMLRQRLRERRRDEP
jgi:RNA polymerase sigma factor for flagellar operon FliA